MTAVFPPIRRLAVLLLAACHDGTSPTPTSEPLAAGTGLAALRGSWTSRAPMPEGRALHQAGVLGNGTGRPRLYVFNGEDPEELFEHPVRSIAIFDVVANTWRTVSVPLGIPVLSRTNGIGLIGGKFYLPGGSDESGDGHVAQAHLLEYDAVMNAWTRKADMPEAGSRGVTGVIDGKLYVLLGLRNYDPECPDCGPPVPIRRFYRYDPGTETWTTLPRSPNYHAAGAAGVIDGKLYVAGGRGPKGLTSALDIYDPATNAWTVGASMPVPSSGLAGAVIGNTFHVFGGPNGEVRAYNAEKKTWAMRTPMAMPRELMAAAKVVTSSGATVSVVGGSTDTGTEHDVFVP